MILFFAFGADIFDERNHAILVLALVLSCTLTPILLNLTMWYFNKKALSYLDGPTFKKVHVEGGTSLDHMEEEDTMVPLYLVIQTRSKPMRSIQSRLKKFAVEKSLAIIDHRCNVSLDDNKRIVTCELYVEDVTTRVELKIRSSEESNIHDDLMAGSLDPVVVERCNEIDTGLAVLFTDEGAHIKVQRWYPHELQQSKGDVAISRALEGTEEEAKQEITDPQQDGGTTSSSQPGIPNNNTIDLAARRFLESVDGNELIQTKAYGMRPKLSSRDIWEEEGDSKERDPKALVSRIFQDFAVDATMPEKLGGYVRKREKQEKK